jgi:N-methylhydantoinase A
VLAERPRRTAGTPPFSEPAHRPVFFDQGWSECPIHRRADLYRGDEIHGPAVIEEYGSTLPLHPGYSARVDAHGNLVMTHG